jgi:hypothetical protein
MRDEGVSRTEEQVMTEPAERLRLAFQWIEHERALVGAAPVSELIERAAKRFELSASQVLWARWSLQPACVAVQPKEPMS